MSRHLLQRDERTGREVWVVEEDGKCYWCDSLPADDIVRANQIAAVDSLNQRWGGGQRVASIPLNLFWRHLKDAVDQHDDRYVARWINDPDHRAFRTFWKDL